MPVGPDHPYLVPFDGSFRVAEAPTKPPADAATKGDLKDRLDEWTDRLDDLQRRLYAQDEFSLLLVFQAMDAAGKDSTIRAVMRGINPAGCQVSSFKQPSKEELDHDFLWRTAQRLPERGRIGIFNRSYYEEVLVIRVHPEYLKYQRLPHVPENLDDLWEARYKSIRDHEKHLADNGTIILKFWLNVSKDEQRDRFLSRLEDPEKHWKFSEGDLAERALWSQYMAAYETALNATSRPWAPWYAIPADDKNFMREQVSATVVQALKALNLTFPEVDEKAKSRFAELQQRLKDEG